MKLIVFDPMVCTYKVGGTSFQLWIPPLSLMKWCTNIKSIIHRRRIFSNSAKFYELFYPIHEDSNSSHIETILPIYGSFNKHRETYTQISQCKEVSPNKSPHPFELVPYWLSRFHCLFLQIQNQCITTTHKNLNLTINTSRALSFP